MSIKQLLTSSAFMMSLALIVALLTNFAGLFPSDTLTADVRSNLTIFILAMMLTISLSKIPYKNLNPITHRRSVARAMVLVLIASAIPLIGYFALKDTEYGAQAMGLVFLAATPFAASVAPLSFILRGDMDHAVRGTIIVYIFSLIWIPFLVWVTLGEVVNMENVFITVIELIGVPLVVSRLLTRFKINRDVMAAFLNCCIFVTVWLSVGSTNFSGMGAFIFFVFVIIAALRSFGLGCTTEVVEKRLNIPWTQRVTDVLMVSYKNKGIAIAVCMAVLAPTGLAPMAMVAIATSIIVEVCWVVFMDSVLFCKKRMMKELGTNEL